jgi:hypothetical protein
MHEIGDWRLEITRQDNLQSLFYCSCQDPKGFGF